MSLGTSNAGKVNLIINKRQRLVVIVSCRDCGTCSLPPSPSPSHPLDHPLFAYKVAVIILMPTRYFIYHQHHFELNADKQTVAVAEAVAATAATTTTTTPLRT